MSSWWGAAFGLLLLGACGTRPPGTPLPAGATSEEPHAADDADGEVEASDVGDDPDGGAPEGPCPHDMVLVEAEDVRVCVDTYEASLVETDATGTEKPYPYWLPVDGHTVRAVSVPDVFPQGFISEVQADDACQASSKRLCTHVEWKAACMGPQKTPFPYGASRQPGTCHDTGKSAVGAVFGAKALASPSPAPPGGRCNGAAAPCPLSSPAPPGGRCNGAAAPCPPLAHQGGHASTAKPGARPKPGTKTRPASKPTGKASVVVRPRVTRPGAATPANAHAKKKPSGRPAKPSARPASVEPSVWAQLNDPRLGQVDGALAKTGTHPQCTNGYGALDMMGNLHEWVKTDASLPHGTFAGGYYLDTSINGDGCNYRTTAHAHDYHDYSTGFRCCAEPR